MSRMQPTLTSLTAGTAEDLDQVIDVMKAAFDEQFGEGWTRSQCAGILPMPGVRLVVARKDGGTVAGFSLARNVADEAELLLIAVRPEHRHQGIGRLLLEEFLDRSRNGGIRSVHLEVRDGNPALMMYRSAGFEDVGRRPGYYSGRGGAQFDAITLRKSLAGIS